MQVLAAGVGTIDRGFKSLCSDHFAQWIMKRLPSTFGLRMFGRTLMVRACVIGWPIQHSRSPLIHGHWLAKLAFHLNRHAPENIGTHVVDYAC